MVSAPSLLLPASVRGLASCVSDGAACTTHTAPSASTLSVTTTYRLAQRSGPPLLLRLTWSHAPLGAPALAFSTTGPASPAAHIHRCKGTLSLPSPAPHPPLALFWDLAAARFASGSPEPASGFFVVAVARAEVVLAIGDLAAEFVKARFDVPAPRPHPAARAERVVAAPDAVHAARVRFAAGAPEHEVAVGCCRCSSGPGEEEEEELWVCVDGRRAVRARRLRWNFRGNQTVFVDGAPVDVLWDLHGWWSRDPPGCAVVMLRARSALESRLWLEEDTAAAAAPGFALVVQAFKTPP
ncbi:hypothetical protein BS78_05G049300 [Paspalum vaginatum]|nr:hypothetical protein BS78_05G049300 [Paspalum vaginatum]